MLNIVLSKALHTVLNIVFSKALNTVLSMSISNLPGRSGLDIVASASASAVAFEEKLTPGIDDLTFTTKTGSYKARWADIDLAAGAADVVVAIIIPWSNGELDARGICATLVGPDVGGVSPGQDIELRRIGAITAPSPETSRVEFVIHTTAGGNNIDTTVRFSIC